ncbi:MAG: P-loop NTPase, partial [Actinomycetes bacterium]
VMALFVNTGEVPERAAEKLHYDGEPAVLASQIVVTPNSENGTITVASTGADGTEAARRANTFAESLIEFLRDRATSETRDQLRNVVRQMDQVTKSLQQLDRRAAVAPDNSVLAAERSAEQARYQGLYGEYQALNDQLAATTPITVLQEAVPVPTLGEGGFSAPTSRAGRIGAAALLGLLLGAALALGIERFDTRLRGRRAFEEVFRLPVVASVPPIDRGHRGRHQVLAATEPDGAVAEAYRGLRSALALLPSRPLPGDPSRDSLVTGPSDPHSERPVIDPRVLIVASPRAGDGKTTTIVNLASTLVEAGRSVIILDCDFRNPETHAFLNVPEGMGLSDLLTTGESPDLDAILHFTNIPGVLLALAGQSTVHPGALTGFMRAYVEQAREMADVVLLDVPPVLLANDAVDLLPLADAVVVVARDGRTGRTEAQRVAALLARLRVPCLGTVLIAATDAGASYFRRGEATRRRLSRGDRTVHLPDDTGPVVRGRHGRGRT